MPRNAAEKSINESPRYPVVKLVRTRVNQSNTAEQLQTAITEGLTQDSQLPKITSTAATTATTTTVTTITTPVQCNATIGNFQLPASIIALSHKRSLASTCSAEQQAIRFYRPRLYQQYSKTSLYPNVIVNVEEQQQQPQQQTQQQQQQQQQQQFKQHTLVGNLLESNLQQKNAQATKVKQIGATIAKRKRRKSPLEVITEESNRFYALRTRRANAIVTAATQLAKKKTGNLSIIPNPFDPLLLYKIEAIEEEPVVKEKKRKRPSVASFSARKRPVNKKQTLTEVASNSSSSSSGNNSSNSNLNINTEAHTISEVGKTGGDTMSLYERRYPTDDGRATNVTNGYVAASSSLRNVMAANVIVDAQDAQDVSNQYYITSSTATSLNTIAAFSSSAAGSTSSSSSNLNAINHAPSMATLCNIGNTCYLNSVVYTLRFAPQFLHSLHHLVMDLGSIQRYIARTRGPDQCNNTNIGGNGIAVIDGKSSQQLLTEKLHELYENLHRNEAADSSEPFHADTLLHAIQDVCTIFEGNQQQDAHEFLMCVLNSIRDTCQSLIKAIAEYPDVIGYICQLDEVDASAAALLDKDHHASSSGIATAGGQSATTTTPTASTIGNSSSLSSLSTSNISKAATFFRKTKRKDESKSSKNSRLQSPLKEGTSAHQAVSNSLFYLNSIDLASSTASSTSGKVNSLHADDENNCSAGGVSGGSGSGSSAFLKDKRVLSEKIRELGLNFFSENFEGITVATTKCLSCETITEQKESMIDIAVPVPIAGYEGADYVDKNGDTFIQNAVITREYFRGENKYRCEQCTGYTEAIRSVSYEVLPRLLIIQLSRFSGGMEKINSYIPTAFTLQCFCAKCCELSDGNKLHIYKLYSVITHVGATMSVGHYIAYTSSLDMPNEYINCAKDRHTAAQQLSQMQQLNGILATQHQHSNYNANAAATPATNASTASSIAASGSNLIKKMKFVRSKASSSGDMTKNLKNLNGITSKSSIVNGLGRLSMNTTCQSLNCCATRICSAQQQQQLSNVTGSSSDLSEESLQNGMNSSQLSQSSSCNSGYATGYGSTGRGSARSLYGSGSVAAALANSTEPIWYMCDDDKIKAMTQREFEELLSPSRKITVTPYLLFYARYDLQTSTAAATAERTTATASWSNESLHNSGLSRM